MQVNYYIYIELYDSLYNLSGEKITAKQALPHFKARALVSNPWARKVGVPPLPS